MKTPQHPGADDTVPVQVGVTGLLAGVRPQKILLCTNLLPHSDRAMERAVRLAVEYDANLLVLYAAPSGQERAPSALDRLSDPEIAEEVERHLYSIPGSDRLKGHVVIGHGPIEVVVALHAAAWSPDLIVVGVHRSDLLRDVFAVTTIEKITVATETPVLVVRNKNFGPYRRVLAAVDFQAVACAQVLAAATLAPEGGMTLLHVIDLPRGGDAAGRVWQSPDIGFEAAFNQVLSALPPDRIQQCATRIRQGDVPETLIAATHEERPDLIVLGTQGRQGVERILIGSIAHDVLEHLPTDVLLVCANAEKMGVV